MTLENRHRCSDEELACLAKMGDSDALTQLIVRCMPMIKSKANEYSNTPTDKDDFVQEGLIGLVKAVRSFDSTKNTAFMTYCTICVVSRMLSGITLLRSNKHHAMYNYLPFEQLEGTENQAKDIESDPLDLYVKQEEQEYMQQQIRTLLSGLEQETLALYISGHSYAEVASLLHCSTKAVDNALQRVRRKLRDVKS